ncbi:hypothetical protein D9M71_525100 [compost metagenome]
MLTIKGDDRPHADAGSSHVNQQKADAALLLGLWIGAYQAEHPVGVVRHGSPGFLAADHIMITVAHRASPQAGQVGTGARFRIALAPPVFGAENIGQKAHLLLRRAELDDHWANHVDAKRHHARGTYGGTLFFEYVFFHHSPTRAAELNRPAGRQPATLVEQTHPGHHVMLVEALAMTTTRSNVGRQLVAQECTDLLAKGQFVGGKSDVHRGLLKSNRKAGKG